MCEFFKRLKTVSVPAVLVVSVARGDAWRRVARDGLWAACAVRLGPVPALTQPLARTAAGQRFFFCVKGGPAMVERKRRYRFQVSGGGKMVIVTGR